MVAEPESPYSGRSDRAARRRWRARVRSWPNRVDRHRGHRGHLLDSGQRCKRRSVRFERTPAADAEIGSEHDDVVDVVLREICLVRLRIAEEVLRADQRREDLPGDLGAKVRRQTLGNAPPAGQGFPGSGGAGIRKHAGIARHDPGDFAGRSGRAPRTRGLVRDPVDRRDRHRNRHDRCKHMDRGRPAVE